jgi:hypothetical protein
MLPREGVRLTYEAIDLQGTAQHVLLYSVCSDRGCVGSGKLAKDFNEMTIGVAEMRRAGLPHRSILRTGNRRGGQYHD